MMKNRDIIQISHLAFDCSWLMVPYDVSINGPAEWVLTFELQRFWKFPCHTLTFRFFSVFRHISLPKRPFCSPTFANFIWKDLHALIFDKSVHCAVSFPIYGFCTVCQICYRHCVTCHFWSNILGKWLLAGVSKFVPYLNIAISLWKSDFEGSSSWSECLIKEYRSKKFILLRFLCQPLFFWIYC